MSNIPLTDMIAALAFTGLPEGSHAEREDFLREWACAHYFMPGMRDRAAVVGHAADAFKFLRLGHADLAAQRIASILKQFAAIEQAEASQAAWAAENPELAQMIDEVNAQFARVERAVAELATSPLDKIIAYASLIDNGRERIEVYRLLAQRAVGERRVRLIEAGAQDARLLEDPWARCFASLSLLPLLEGAQLATMRELTLTSAITGLLEMEPLGRPAGLEDLAPHLSEAAADDLVIQIQATADDRWEGGARAMCLFSLTRYVSEANRERTHQAAQRALEALDPDTHFYVEQYLEYLRDKR